MHQPNTEYECKATPCVSPFVYCFSLQGLTYLAVRNIQRKNFEINNSHLLEYTSFELELPKIVLPHLVPQRHRSSLYPSMYMPCARSSFCPLLLAILDVSSAILVSSACIQEPLHLCRTLKWQASEANKELTGAINMEGQMKSGGMWQPLRGTGKYTVYPGLKITHGFSHLCQSCNRSTTDRQGGTPIHR